MNASPELRLGCGVRPISCGARSEDTSLDLRMTNYEHNL